jgi:hypothetical protein
LGKNRCLAMIAASEPERNKSYHSSPVTRPG